LEPVWSWLGIIVGDFNHDVGVTLAALRQHGLRLLAVAEDTEVFKPLVDFV
jgi:hypothetical protein